MAERAESLVDLAIQAGPAPEGVDQLTHIIASVPAVPLTRAAKSADLSYDQLVQLKENRPDLYRSVTENPMPERSLASDILVRQQQLSRHRRRLAVVASTAILGLGGFTFGYETKVDSNQRANEIAAEIKSSDQIDEKEGAFSVGALFGTLSGAIGGFSTVFMGLGQAGRLARRPAQKIVRKAERGF